MDFGTGRELDDGSTSDLTGTPLYLAPEVFRGESATVRSDIYALGVLLFRMVSGSYPVNGTTIGDVRRQHDRGIRARVRDAAPAVPPALASVIEQAIDPDPARRFVSAEAMGAALTADRRPRSPSTRALAVMGVFAIVAASLTWVAAGSNDRGQVSGPRLAVLPFENLGPPSDDGIARGLGSDVQRSLASLDGIVTLAFPSLADVPVQQQSVSALACELRADLLLDGSLRRAGPTMQVRARLVRAADGVELWTQTIDRPVTAVATIKGDLARALARRLSLRQRVALVDRTRSDVYLLLAEARSFQERRVGADALQAAALFERATELDPDNAQAWAGLSRSLASAHRLRGGDENQPPNPLMQAGAIRAIQLDDWLADAHAAMGTVHAENRDWGRAETAFRRALELNPSLTSVHTDFALSVLMPLERLDEGIRLLEGAVNLDPTSLDVRRVLAHFLVNVRRYDEAIATANWVLERKPDFPFTKIWLGRALALSGRHDEAVTVLSGDPGLWAYLGYTYAVMGRRADAEALAATHPADARGLMLVFGGLKDKPRALQALERLAASNPWRAATWLQRPEMDVLLGDPSANALRTQLGLPMSGSRRF
jgi:TolB-like protein